MLILKEGQQWEDHEEDEEWSIYGLSDKKHEASVFVYVTLNQLKGSFRDIGAKISMVLSYFSNANYTWKKM